MQRNRPREVGEGDIHKEGKLWQLPFFQFPCKLRRGRGLWIEAVSFENCYIRQLRKYSAADDNDDEGSIKPIFYDTYRNSDVSEDDGPGLRLF